MATIPGARRETGEEEQSFSELLGAVTGDLQKLFRQELALAKAEMREEAVKTGKAAGLLSGAAVAGYLALLLLSLAVMFGLAELIGLGWAALVVAVVWAVVGGVLAVVGRNRMREVSPKPERTIETLKEDAQWAKHPTR
ncbi:phage holin family protein [Nocardiopsis sp. HUAS JQ3]|uniref:phage holin family protein n=1 Tax=Nocardiopsis sp. HUAS JQ3 TaxID=3061629 RepID=UPI0023A9B7F1|nr:phage holin family protein [Nocardiopsis sp. HUAS JQ3]WDZ90299.1 phage holin family protein [Nocardiopsis sp. HUAS JQ3]